MSDKASKLVIEIDDIEDQSQCVAAIRKLFGAIKDRHGRTEAERLWRYREAPPPDRRKRSRLGFACMSFNGDDLRLILDYYAMPKPNKEKLARDLAKKNETLPERERYPVKSAEDPAAAILQQIKRAFRFDRQACRIIGETPADLRREKLAEVEETLRRTADLKRHIRLPRIRRITIRQRLGGRAEYSWIFDKHT